MNIDSNMFRFALTSIVTLFVVIDPLGVVPLFVSMTNNVTSSERTTILKRAVLLAFCVAIFFLFAGKILLTELGVSVAAFSISGGILLFLIALPMLFGHRGGMMSSDQPDENAHDIAIFPLAIPLLSGPGTLTTVLTLEAAAKGSLELGAIIIVSIAIIFAITAVLLQFGGALVLRMGRGGVNVVTRVLGIILAALAVQFVLSGIAGFTHIVR
jgi:multiple antibiotic resistance protein